MIKTSITRRLFAATIAATSLVGMSSASFADGHQVVDSIHFLILAVLVAAGMALPAAPVRL